jgi:hypothetical protein
MLKLIESTSFRAALSSEAQVLSSLCKELLEIKRTDQLPRIADLIQSTRTGDAHRVLIWLDRIYFLSEMLKTGLEEQELQDVESEIEYLKVELEKQRAAAASVDSLVRRSSCVVIKEEARESLDSEYT